MRAIMTVETGLAWVGARMPARGVHRLTAAVNYVNTGHWMRAHGADGIRRFWHREEVFDVAAREVRGERVLYMEFGVWEGAAMRWWSSALTHPEAILTGFDSFEGLPHTWTLKIGKGHFDKAGRVPDIADPRVTFVPGWFNETLPKYQWPDGYDRLIAVVDADLYTSTVDVLNFLEPHLKVGSFLFFDEFNHAADEQRAFDEFLERTGMSFQLRAATIEFGRVLFERTG